LAGRTVLYRYGWMAWLWRALILAALAAGGVLVIAGMRSAAPHLFLIAAPLALPALFFGHVVATSVVRQGDDALTITNLLFLRRRIARSELGRPRVRPWAQTWYGQMYAPSSWIPVRRALPVYLDLLADIPDRRAFANAFRLQERELPQRRR
jgi:hypothetical protein